MSRKSGLRSFRKKSANRNKRLDVSKLKTTLRGGFKFHRHKPDPARNHSPKAPPGRASAGVVSYGVDSLW